MIPELLGFIALLREGFSLPDVAAFALRFNVGLFFAISGWNKLTDSQCHGMLCRNLERSGIPCVHFTVWWVAGWEFVAGVTLALGLFTAASAFILFIVCVVAFIVSHRRKIARKNPVHRLDAATEYLCMFDVLLTTMLLAVMAMGPGKYSLDRWL